MAPAETPALLVLEDGRTFRGVSFGAEGETFGEAVFSTAMSGYQETLTDPSYRRQVVVATAPHIGNTGWNDDDDESRRIWVAGYVVRDLSRVRSNWRSNRSLDAELRAQGVVGIAEVDTRALTRHLRERGAMRVGISTLETDPERLLPRVLQQPPMAGANLVGEVTVDAPVVVPARGGRRFTVAAIDLGIKDMTPQLMAARGLEVHILPASSTLADIRATGADGVFFSNGPGDPAAALDAVRLLTDVLDAGLPYFGICFGNQIFGRALGFGTYKLKYGHRGINQPVMDLSTGRVEITAQNHGFAVDAPLEGSTPTPWGDARVSHVCLNDDVVEGLELRDASGHLRAFSVQYHPEAAAGPHDSAYLFDRFIEVLERAGEDGGGGGGHGGGSGGEGGGSGGDGGGDRVRGRSSGSLGTVGGVPSASPSPTESAFVVSLREPERPPAGAERASAGHSHQVGPDADAATPAPWREDRSPVAPPAPGSTDRSATAASAPDETSGGAGGARRDTTKRPEPADEVRRVGGATVPSGPAADPRTPPAAVLGTEPVSQGTEPAAAPGQQQTEEN